MFGTTFSEPWRERLQTQPQISSSSSAAAEEFPAKVLQQIVSHPLRSLGKHPPAVGRRVHRASLNAAYLLSLSSLRLFFFSGEKRRSTDVRNTQEILCCWSFVCCCWWSENACHSLPWELNQSTIHLGHVNITHRRSNLELSKYPRDKNVNLVTTRQSRSWLLLCHTHVWC